MQNKNQKIFARNNTQTNNQQENEIASAQNNQQNKKNKKQQKPNLADTTSITNHTNALNTLQNSTQNEKKTQNISFAKANQSDNFNQTAIKQQKPNSSNLENNSQQTNLAANENSTQKNEKQNTVSIDTNQSGNLKQSSNTANSPQKAFIIPPQNAQKSKKDTASTVLLIIGTILFCVSLFLVILFGDSVANHFSPENDQEAGTAIGVVLTFIYFGFPSLIVSIASSVLNITAFCLSRKQKILKLIFMTLSIITAIISIVLCVLINFL